MMGNFIETFHSKYGVFCHYLGEKNQTADDWNRQVDSFDVEGLAKQLQSVGASYFFITIGQGSGHYCAPNETYDRLTGITPSKCSRRDLVADLYEALNPPGIDLLVYAPSDGSFADKQAREGLGLKYHWSDNDVPMNKDDWSRYRLPEFARNWESVLREWAMRWADKIKGWWIDGCYHKQERFPDDEEPNLISMTRALKSGNPDAIVAFNGGVITPVIRYHQCDDYTAGEISIALPVGSRDVPITRFVDGAQYHILSFLGEHWGHGPMRFSDEFVVSYTKYIISKGGVITWDVPIGKNGLIPDDFIQQLSKLKCNDS